MKERLNASTLGKLPSHVARPRYDRATLAAGIVHLGIGAFQRAHQAMYTEAALNAGDLRWGIVGASLRSPAARDALAPQDCLYTIAVRSGAGTEHRIIGSVLQTEVARNNSAHLIAPIICSRSPSAPRTASV